MIDNSYNISSLLQTVTFAITCCVSISTNAQRINEVQQIEQVTVNENRSANSLRSVAPLQTITNENLANHGATNIGDALKTLSGVSIKDYGGIGGLKTVSVRSLGASHTVVSYDGLAMTDGQTGQIDLGRMSVNNVSAITLTNGQCNGIFCPAKLVASSAVIEIESLVPSFNGNSRYAVKTSVKSGSLGLISVAANAAAKIDSSTTLSLVGEYLHADGMYKYRLHYGTSRNDSSSIERRRNTDIGSVRLESSLNKQMTNGGRLHCKAYLYRSERGLPGATVFYNARNFSQQRLEDCNTFAQLRYLSNNHKSILWQLNAKYSYNYTHYTDPTYLNTQGCLENVYKLHEGYLSGCLMWRNNTSFSASTSVDATINALYANTYDFAYPLRMTWLVATAGRYVSDKLTATATLVATFTDEHSKHGEPAGNRHRVSPYIGATFTPFETVDLHLRAFYKNSFRLPTFNDLYYSQIGNANLLPESANQLNVGLTYGGKILPIFTLSLTADAYHNRVSDKIVAYPTKNLFVWTMLNFGKVDIDGLDITGHMDLALPQDISLSVGGGYTYQRSQDRTQKCSETYGHQIPYTPRVSGSADITVSAPYVTVCYTLLWSGHRYSASQNIAANRMQGYKDHSITAQHVFNFKTVKATVGAECINMANDNYAVVRYFPMPGRQWRGNLTLEF